MKRKEFWVPSSDGVTMLHGVRWLPEGEIKGVFQMNHGMVEHIGRYRELAEYMAEAGFAVIGHDHLGHGDSVTAEENRGFFAEKSGDVCLVRDMHRITCLARKWHPSLPLFILGHSMGSFLLRRYITRYGGEVDGAIICGTGEITGAEAKMGIRLAQAVGRTKGFHYRSPLLGALALGRYTMQYGNPIHPGSWLSKNEASVAEYATDPKCGFLFTAGAYLDFFRLLRDLGEEKDFDRMPRSLPILFISGMEDPLGGYSKKVLKVYNRFVELKMEDVDIFLYPGDRHEVLNETDREKVYEDLRRWMESRCKK